MSRIYCDRDYCYNCNSCDECPVTLQDKVEQYPMTIEEQAIKNNEAINNVLDFKEDL